MSTTRQQLRPMKPIPGGTFWMGSADFYPEESPVHQVNVDSFWFPWQNLLTDGFRCVVRGTSPAGR
jgi:formylglycine-generating enzyme